MERRRLHQSRLNLHALKSLKEGMFRFVSSLYMYIQPQALGICLAPYFEVQLNINVVVTQKFQFLDGVSVNK